MPSNDNSPITNESVTSSWAITPIATIKATAIGRSKCAPSLVTSAGAKLIAMRLAGKERPMEDSAERIRSFDSATALSANPTIIMAGRPFDKCA